MAWLEAVTVVTSHKDDAWVFWLDNRCHMYEHNLRQHFANEATKMSASPTPLSWQYQNVQPWGHHDNVLTLEVGVIRQGRKGDSCRRVSHLAT